MHKFTEGNLLEKMIAFSVPIITANFLQSVYMFIDALWVGRLIGHRALAAISVVSPVLFFFFAFVIGLSVATNILIGQSLGSKNHHLAGKVISNSFLAVIVLSLTVSVLGIVFNNRILLMVNTPDEIMPLAKIYLVIILSGFIFKALYNWLSAVLRGMGNSKIPLIILLMSVIFNIILTPMLILGTGFFPVMGIAGSAVASVLSLCFSIMLGYLFIIKKNDFFTLSGWHSNIVFSIIKKVIFLAWPVSAQLMVRSLSWAAIIALINRFGPKLTAAYGIGIRIDMLAFLPALSIGMAVSSMSAQNFGAGKSSRISELLKYSLGFSFLFSFVFFLVVNMFPFQIASLFTKDCEVIKYTAGYLRVISIAYLMFSFIFSTQGIIRGSGNTFILFIFSFFSMFVIRIPLVYLLCLHTNLKEYGIWIGIVLSTAVAVFLNLFYYLSGKWKKE